MVTFNSYIFVVRKVRTVLPVGKRNGNSSTSNAFQIQISMVHRDFIYKKLIIVTIPEVYVRLSIS